MSENRAKYDPDNPHEPTHCDPASDLSYAVRYAVGYLEDTRDQMDEIARDLDRLSKHLDEYEKRQRGATK